MRRHGGIQHVLARHVEGASHMAEGYTRAKAGNIGVCIGTSGPAGTDMITGLYSASADLDSDLVHHRAGSDGPVAQGRLPGGRHRLHRRTLSKMAVTVLEPAQVPGSFSRPSIDAIRPSRPVLIDLPFDVQMAEIEFDPDTYTPLPVYKPAASQAQIAKALDMLVAAERPLIVAGGGIINAEASELLVEFAETLNVPVIPTLMGWGDSR